jgi:MoaA/NifB/PqqE/SkfB family radical SAM enzyme
MVGIFKNQIQLKHTLDSHDPVLTRVILPWLFRHPRYLRSFIRLSRTYERSVKSRKKELNDGIKVPPFLILSITPQCNLRCAGCYAVFTQSTQQGVLPENGNKGTSLDFGHWHRIISEAVELGVFGFVIGGGEPFLFPGLLELCKRFNDRFFIIVTNGTMISKKDFKRLKRLGNVALIVSIEAGKAVTDSRRGRGVYTKVLDVIRQLCRMGVITGISVTVNRYNFRYWMENRNIDYFIKMGVRIGIFLEYIPNSPVEINGNASADLQTGPCQSSGIQKDITELEHEIRHKYIHDDQSLILTKKERAEFRRKILDYRSNKKIYLVHSPGDEDYFGGCVSAGKGFAHITPNGDLTPCPVSNIATHNLKISSLRDGLSSRLFEEIRRTEHLLENGDTPCALFAHPKEVDELVRAVGGYRAV